MIKIRKGSKTMVIPAGAYEPIYAPSGWEIDGKKPENSPEKATPETPEKAPVDEPSESPEEVETEELEEDEDVEYVDPEELNEKPIEELDFEELKILAEYLGVNIKGLKSKKEVLEAIKKFKAKK